MLKKINVLLITTLILTHLFCVDLTKPKPKHIPINNLISVDYKTWQPKDFHKEWIRDSLQPGIPQIPWTINWEYQPLNYRIAGITRHIDDHYILIDLNPLYAYEWDHVFMHELIHAQQIIKGDLVQNGDIWYWKGEIVDWSISWGNRPWEIDAEKRAKSFINSRK